MHDKLAETNVRGTTVIFRSASKSEHVCQIKPNQRNLACTVWWCTTHFVARGSLDVFVDDFTTYTQSNAMSKDTKGLFLPAARRVAPAPPVLTSSDFDFAAMFPSDSGSVRRVGSDHLMRCISI